MKILDCSLRDGGYLTNWNWESELVRDTVRVLNESGIDIIEIGYRSPEEVKKACGLYRYCEDEHIRKVLEKEYNNLCAMVDMKDYMSNGVLDIQLLIKYFKKKNESPFEYVRIAIDISESIDEYHAAKLAVDVLHSLGYKIILNIMKISIVKNMPKFEGWPIEHLYFANSFGSAEMRSILNKAENICNVNLGYHGHANSLRTMPNRIHYGIFDATIIGIGRGAGNTELIGLMLESGLDVRAVYDLQKKYFEPLRKQYQWGYNYAYHYSGIENIHPNYVTALMAKHNNPIDIIEELKKIPLNERSKFKGVLCP